jgi:cadmium resistance protein CadD (predicted permease)
MLPVNEVLSLIPLAAVAFIATNLDNLVLLIAFLSRFIRTRVQVIGGYLAGAAAIIVLGFCVGVLADRMPLQYLGYLGAIPVALGLKGLYDIFRKTSGDRQTPAQARGGLIAGTVFLAQLANGTDSIITFGVVYADTRPEIDWIVTVTLAAMAGLMASLALYAVNHQALGAWVDRFGRYITPFILLYVGTYILLNTATDALPG